MSDFLRYEDLSQKSKAYRFNHGGHGEYTGTKGKTGSYPRVPRGLLFSSSKL